MPPAVPEAVTRASRSVLGAGAVPEWSRDLPGGGRRRVPHAATTPAAVYLPSCLGTLFAPADGGDGVQAAVLGLAERAGVELLVPEGIDQLCCGTPWSSKGLDRGYRSMERTVVEAVREATSGGVLPVVVDASSCTEGYLRLLADAEPAIRVIDSVAFVADTVLPRLTVHRRLSSLALHPTCSSRRLGTDDAAVRLASAVAEEVVVPASWQCCAFAGDRGLLHPELTASATRDEAAEVAGRTFEAYASVNRTCEIGMTRATGRSYVHLLELVCRAVD
jgi:D-lactate dehydrogenase